MTALLRSDVLPARAEPAELVDRVRRRLVDAAGWEALDALDALAAAELDLLAERERRGLYVDLRGGVL